MPKYFFILLIASARIILCQSIKENWLPIVSGDDSKTYINTTGLNISLTGDIFVWVMEEFDSAMQLEGIDESIYQSKTYYLFNKEKWRYSILQVIYFDEDRNVLKNYSYSNTSDLPDLKYNTPILIGSSAEVILNKCNELLAAGKSE